MGLKPWDRPWEEIEIVDYAKRSIHLKPNADGYQIAIGHPLILPLWKEWCQKWKNGEIENEKSYSPTERRLHFERNLMDSEFYKNRMSYELNLFGASFKAVTGIEKGDIEQRVNFQ